jgi:Protein of unknown function (DUF3309)
MNLVTVLLVVLVIVLLLGVPVAPWGRFHSFGWGPSGIVGVVLVVLLILLLLGRI